MSEKTIPITDAKALAEKHGCDQIVVLAYDREADTTHVVTWGRTIKDCREAAQAQEWWDGRVLKKSDD